MALVAFARSASDAGFPAAGAAAAASATISAALKGRTKVIPRSYVAPPPCARLCLPNTIPSLMEKSGSHPGVAHAHAHAEGHDIHEDLGFWRKYVFSLDHKVIGIQYAVTGLTFLLFGFTLMMIMRWQLAFPGRPIPLIGPYLGNANAPGGIMLPEFYNQLGAMHGTIMVFLGVVPLAVGGFGNFVMPLQIGAPDMAFPKLNMMSYWVYFLGGVTMLSSFFLMGGSAQSGCTSYTLLAILAGTGPTLVRI